MQEIQEMQVRSLGWEDPLEEEISWILLQTLVGYSPWGHKELDMTEAT